MRVPPSSYVSESDLPLCLCVHVHSFVFGWRGMDQALAGPSRAEPGRTGPGPAEPGRAGPGPVTQPMHTQIKRACRRTSGDAFTRVEYSSFDVVSSQEFS